MTFESFVQKEHQKRVNHFVRYCTAEDRAPRIDDAVEIFGFCKADATPIVEDAIKQMAA